MEEASEINRAAAKLAANSHRLYENTTPTVRRRFNQPFFRGVYIEGHAIVRRELQDPFEVLLSGG